MKLSLNTPYKISKIANDLEVGMRIKHSNGFLLINSKNDLNILKSDKENIIEIISFPENSKHLSPDEQKGVKSNSSTPSSGDADIQAEEVLDKYFPKGDKRRGEALAVYAIANAQAIKEERERCLKEILQWLLLHEKWIGKGTYSEPVTLRYFQAEEVYSYLDSKLNEDKT